MIGPDDVLEFWFAGDPHSGRTVWFRQDDAFDADCVHLAEALKAAGEGALERWSKTPRGMLALIILFDQLSRNLYRDSPLAFANDEAACRLAREAVGRGFDQMLTPRERSFVYLPFEHSESPVHQDESVRLFETLRLWLGDATAEYAYRHRDIIRRFGRFPHRNAVLGRASTEDELTFLKRPDAGF